MRNMPDPTTVACDYCYASYNQACTDRRGVPPLYFPHYLPDQPVVNDHLGRRSIPPTNVQEDTTMTNQPDYDQTLFTEWLDDEDNAQSANTIFGAIMAVVRRSQMAAEEVKALRHQVDSLANENSALHADLAAADAEISRHREAEADARTQAAALTTARDMLSSQFNSTKADLDECERELISTMEANAELIAENERLREMLDADHTPVGDSVFSADLLAAMHDSIERLRSFIDAAEAVRS